MKQRIKSFSSVIHSYWLFIFEEKENSVGKFLSIIFSALRGIAVKNGCNLVYMYALSYAKLIHFEL